MASRLEACSPCHGDKGQGTSDVYFPRLAGKPAGYLYNQLLAFKNGRRKYPPMNYLLEFLPDPYLQDIADYFGDQRPPLPAQPPSEVSNDVLRHGETLVARGDASRQIPACASCHGHCQESLPTRRAARGRPDSMASNCTMHMLTPWPDS